MTVKTISFPMVLAIGGFDPSGCAGLHADIETVTALGAHCMSLVTCQTIQNAQRMIAQIPASTDLFQQQLSLLDEQHNWQGIKLSALGSIEIMHIIITFLDQHPEIPLVIDPVLTSSSGYPFATNKMILLLKKELIPRSLIITPNSLELFLLGKSNDEQTSIQHLYRSGAKNILVTGGHDNEQDDFLINKLFSYNHSLQYWKLKRLKGHFRGTGCLLGSAITTYLSKGESLVNSIEKAQTFASIAIKKAHSLEKNILIPTRINFSS